MKKDLLGLLSKKCDEINIDEASSLTELDRGGEVISFFTPIIVHGVLSRLEEDVVFFSGSCETTINTICGRCLEAVQIPIEFEFDEAVYAKGKEEEYDLIVESKGEEFNLEEFLENLFVLKLPMRFLCSEDCEGLCPICGTNRNTSSCNCGHDKIDERFQKLKSLLETDK